MDLEHPAITKTLRTGYPYNEKRHHLQMVPNKNYHPDYNRGTEESQMNLINVIKDVADHNERVEKTHGVTNIYKNYLGYYNANMHDVEEFYEATKDFRVVFGYTSDQEYPHRASAIVGDVEIAIILDNEEFKELKELVDSE